MSKQYLSVDYLKSLFDYSEDNGEFIRKISRNPKYRVGSIAGAIDMNGYRAIQIDGVSYYGHRLAWLYVHGNFPKSMLDHINGIKFDNRIRNLREVTNQINMQNRLTANCNSKSSLLGASPCQDGRWVAHITVNGKQIYLGYFYSKEQAHKKYIEAKRLLHIGCTI